jgi:hypothetical protein
VIPPLVAHTSEFRRVASLPRRAWTEPQLDALAAELTSILRSPACTSTRADSDGLCLGCGQPLALRRVQAQALYEAGVERGLFGAIGVGEGKTLITLLLPIVLRSRRPLLLLPASLIEKTQRERFQLSQHWRIPTTIRLFSYEMLGREQSAQELDRYAPDGIGCDEVHRLKNRRAAVTRRVSRYMLANPTTDFAGLSGTVMDKSLTDFAHILRWCLKTKAPVPITIEEICEWAEALDEKIDEWNRRRAGALLELASAEDRAAGDDTVIARRAFQRRLNETPGVVATVGAGEHVDCSIYVREIRHKVAPVVEGHFATLRKQWETPDGWPLTSAADVWRHAQELALGLHYVWDPRPPPEWLEARKAWGQFVRATLGKSRTLDSELQVANAYPDADELVRWRLVRDTFRPNVVPIWHDDSALKVCTDWVRSPGIVWTEHTFFAQKLAEVTGLPYFGSRGFDATGRYIEDADASKACVASIDANREGKNLQRLWSRNLLVCPPPSAAWWEQIIARTHRPGQKADEVIVDVLIGCRENFDACEDALRGARAIRDMTGKRQKLLLADVTLPTAAELDALGSARWVR